MLESSPGAQTACGGDRCESWSRVEGVHEYERRCCWLLARYSLEPLGSFCFERFERYKSPKRQAIVWDVCLGRAGESQRVTPLGSQLRRYELSQPPCSHLNYHFELKSEVLFYVEKW